MVAPATTSASTNNTPPDPTSVAMNKIRDVTLRADAQQQRVSALRERYISSHLVRIAALLWRSRCGHRVLSTEEETKALQLAHQRIKYDAGVAGEDLLRLLFALDAVEGEGEIRAARKRAVVHIKALIDECDALRLRASKLDSLVTRVIEYSKAHHHTTTTTTTSSSSSSAVKSETSDETEDMEAGAEDAAAAALESASSFVAPSPQTASMDVVDDHTERKAEAEVEDEKRMEANTTAPNATAAADDDDDDDDTAGDTTAESAADVQAEQHEDATTTTQRTPPPSPTTPRPPQPSVDDELELALEQARAQYPRLQPQWNEEATRDAVHLTLHLPHVRREDMRVTVDNKARTITVAGVRRPQFAPQRQQWQDDDVWSLFAPRQRRMPASTVPAVRGAWFTEELEIPDTLAVDKMEASFVSSVLTLTLPRRQQPQPPKRQQQQRQQQSRRPAYPTQRCRAEDAMSFNPWSRTQRAPVPSMGLRGGWF